MGSIAVFSEKYGEVVRVVDVSSWESSFYRDCSSLHGLFHV